MIFFFKAKMCVLLDAFVAFGGGECVCVCVCALGREGEYSSSVLLPSIAKTYIYYYVLKFY